ncbi:DUF2156 domain-containing protein [Geovibrio thiophilus]|uniref:DUF2156 domain-containing protein n=1 Tax=Geovibrio thiophilus TaxID=139438 RepID=A0A410JVX6_9BACT|nr:phosphatidylglycerol lysyltransferase domain-containing protein [Geovibrio thiophilus]QAR32342.1 DUF2156 domain-containing protein [Geovibrio thiophilus]
MTWENIDLHHKELLYERFRNISEPLSEYTFANIFLFRRTHEYEIGRNGEPVIRGKTYDGKKYIQPVNNLQAYSKEKLLELQKDAEFFFPVSEECLALLDPATIEYTSDEADSDYIYTREKMATYAGRKLHKKRNLMKQFHEEYEGTSRPICGEVKEDALYILEKWQDQADLPKEETDYRACLEALTHCDELVLCGEIYYANGKPCGFILGEELNSETYVMHFAKGLVGFKGVYQFIFNEFAKHLPEKYKYINFEQDMGKESLRQSKRSYLPDLLMKKYRVRFKG